MATGLGSRSMFRGLKVGYENRELLWNLTQRELRARYRRSILGWGWSMLNPAMNTAIYTFVFLIIFKSRAPVGDPSGIKVYSIYFLAGVLPWNFFALGTGTAISSLLGSGQLMTKVYFPRELVPTAAVLALGVSLLIEFGVLIALILVTGHFMLQLIPVILYLIILETLFTLGVGLFLAAVNIRYRDVAYITTIVLQALFFMTPIVYPLSLVTNSRLRTIMNLNPMARFAMAFRNCFYDIRLPGLTTMASLTVISVVVFAVGYRFFAKRAPRFVEDL